jgi:hypothetical protein
MKKIFSLIQLAVLSAGSSAFALVGGPFDNGDYNVLLERAGYYQSSYSFKNGSGYSLFSPDNLQGALLQGQAITPNISSGALSTPGRQQGVPANNANRTVIYYKGITYFGSAFGEVDIQSRRISGYGNASSDFAVSSVQTQQQAGFFSQSNVTSFSSATVTASGRSYVANVNWQGKITATQPQLRYSGSGEIAIISPTGQAAIAGLAFEGYSGLISAINQAVSQLNSTNADVVVGFGFGDSSYDPYGDAQVAINSALTNLTPYLNGTGPNSSFRESEVFKIKTTGYRRFF